MATKTAKPSKPVDLSEYAEEAIPFDLVIKKLAKVGQPQQPKPRRPTTLPKRK